MQTQQERGGDNPSNQPVIHYEAGIGALPFDAQAVLAQVFSDYEQVDIAQELGGGFTQSRVLVAQPVRAAGSSSDLPLVLKIGPTWLIRQEQEGYTRFIRDKLAGRIELVTVELSDGWGVLGYRLAGDGQFKHESLAHYCRQTESDTLTAMLTGRLFKRLGTLWRNADLRPEPYPATKYDLLLPVRLVIEPQLLPAGLSPTLLTPEQLTSDDLAPGDPVRLAGFVISEVDPESREVTLDLPAEAGQKRSHRLRLQPVEAIEHYRVGERLPAVEGRVTQTRRGRLRAEADKVLSSSAELALTDEQLRLAGGRVLPNPLAHLCALLSDWPAVKLAFQHGDLNLENVLVDPATRDVTLIDFANAGVEHVLHDLLHLEMSVVTSLLAEALVEVGETPELIGPVFYDRLHQAATQDPALYTPPRLLQPALKKVYTILAAIRQTAQSYLSNPDDWGEYYRGLALYLVGALKFKDLDETSAAPYPKQLALVGAAVAVEWWQQPQVQPLPVDDLAAFAVDLQSALAECTAYNLSHKQLVLADGTRLLNPLAVLPDLLEPWVGTCLGRVHGRLDLAELITELERQPADLIEADVGQDNQLHHLLRLETAVVAGLLPQALAEANQPPETIHFLFYERLHRALSGDPAHFALPKAIPPALAKPYQLLAAIRRQAARFLTTEADWADYYRGLALYLLGTLHPPEQLAISNGQLTNPVRPSPNPPILQSSNHLTLLTAAITTDLWHQPTPRLHPPAPYQGLHAFQEEDALFFFGRKSFVEQLVETVPHQPLLAVTGASGSGKSSVVLAGLVPRLRQSGEWHIITIRPGSAPFEEMAKVLVSLHHFSDELVHDWAEVLRQGEKNLADLFRSMQISQRLLLIIDQFEELYTLCSEPETRQRFIDMLLAATEESRIGGQGVEIDNQPSPTVAPQSVSDQSAPPHPSTNSEDQPSNPPTLQLSPVAEDQPSNLPTFHLILTLRADFMGKVLSYRPLADALRGNIELLGAMNRAELDRAIEYPAEKLGVSFEAGLVERILDDVGDEPGHLPLLEFALTQLWHLQSNGRLTWAAYESIGRVPGAVTHYAEQVYGSLTPSQQSQARRIFTQLVQPGAGTEDTRRMATAAELEADWPLVLQLADSRLVITNRDATGSEIVEVVHEALIQNWQRLEQWMAADRTFRAWQERLRVALNQWQAIDWDEGGLLRGATLAEAEGWLRQRASDLSLREQDFILRSVALREQQQVAAEAERQRQLAQAQALAETERLRAEEQTEAATRLRRRAIWLGAALTMLLLTILVAIQFDQNARVFEQAAWAAKGRQATAEFLAGVAEQRQATAEAAAKVAEAAEAQAIAAEGIAISARQSAEIDRATAVVAEQTAVAARSVAQHLQSLAQQSEAEAITARQTAVADEATAQAAKALAVEAQQTAQAGQATAEANRATAQTRRTEAETAAQQAQQALAAAEAAKQTAEAAKRAAEQAAAQAEQEKQKAEEAVENAEATRTAAEALRDKAEADLARTRQLTAIIRNTQTCPVDRDPKRDARPEALTYDGNHIWVANKGTELAIQLSAADCNNIVDSYAIGNGPSDIIFDGDYIWVAEQSDNTVRKIDPVSGQVSVFTVGPEGADRPTALLFDDGVLWVALTNFNIDQNEIRQLDPETGQVSPAYKSGRDPFELAFDGSYLWVTNREDHTVSKINAATRDAEVFSVGSNPSSIIYDGAYIWVANETSQNVMKLQVSDGTIIDKFETGDGPVALAFDGFNIWSANKDQNTITGIAVDGRRFIDIPTAREPEDILFDGANLWVVAEIGNVIQRIPINIRPVGRGPTALTHQGGFIWIVNSEDNTLSKVTISNNEPAQTIVLNQKPLALSAAGSNIWVSHRDNTVSKIRGKDGANLGDFSTGGIKPGALTFDGTYIWVANEDSHSVARLRESNGNEITTFPVGKRPVDILFDGSGIWVANYDNQSVVKLSTNGIPMATYSLNGSPTSITYDGVDVWVVYLDFNQLKVKLGKLDNENVSLESDIVINTSFSPPTITYDGRYIWLAPQTGSNTNFGTVVRIDPEDFTDQQAFLTCSEPGDLLQVNRAIWVACQADDFIQKISDDFGSLSERIDSNSTFLEPDSVIELFFPLITKIR